jgi:RNA polymerase sigma-B factor
MGPSSSHDEERDLVARYAAMAPTDPARPGVREALIVMHQPLVRSLAQRYAGRGEHLDDLMQAGSIGLINAVDRFDPERAESFTSFAVATVLGEIRRHFRDRAWSIRVPRRLQELSRAVSQARLELEQSLQRSPTVDELAQHLDVTDEDVLDALEASSFYATTSLDAPLSNDSDADERTADIGHDDEGLAHVLHRAELAPALSRLPEQDRRLLHLRFVEEESQAQIAADLGIDQSQVSRRLTKVLLHLRNDLGDRVDA